MSRIKDEMKKHIENTKEDYKTVGGWTSLKSGHWLWEIIQKSFADYWEKANVEYFESKYGSKDKDFIAKKLISVAAKNAAILGGVTGAAISTDEIVAIVTVGEGGVGLPANVAIAATGIGTEAILLIKFQLQLIANLGKLYNAPLNPDDPEDILTILAFALGGSVADVAGKFGMKIGGRVAGNTAKAIIKKETLTALQKTAAKVGIKILQRSIVKYTIPLASIGIGTGWNYTSTRTVAKIAIKHFKIRSDELNNNGEEIT